MEFIKLYISNDPHIRSEIPTVIGTRLTVYVVFSIYENNELNDYSEINNEMLMAYLLYVNVFNGKQ